MVHKRINAYSAERYVISYRDDSVNTKIFQIAFSKSDGSIFVTLPYYKHGHGRLGQVTLSPALTYPGKLTVGSNFPVTSHYVKYTHHPSGRAHFSLSGKVRTEVGKRSVPLKEASGHLFTLMVQGFREFDHVKPTEKGSNKRGIVPFTLHDNNVVGLKFVAYYYDQTKLAQLADFTDESVWMTGKSKDDSTVVGIVLATPFVHGEKNFSLVIMLQKIGRISKDQEVFLSLLGGFDPPAIALDHSVETSFLMCIYPTFKNFQEQVDRFGTIDHAI